VELHPGYDRRVVKAFETVRCLACGGAYTKPMGRGTATANPGCPDCGYLGWLPFSVEEPSLQHRFDAGRRPRRPA
jgi:predicted  nucleic acid-binding Zn-ribbon protein